MKGTALKKTVTAGSKSRNAWLTKSWKCKLAAGRYAWYVYATDQAGRPQQNPIGHETLTLK